MGPNTDMEMKLVPGSFNDKGECLIKGQQIFRDYYETNSISSFQCLEETHPILKSFGKLGDSI